MNQVNYRKIRDYLEVRLKKPIHAADTDKNDYQRLKSLALYFAVVTGSRPNEAAWIIYHKNIKVNDGKATSIRWGTFTYIAEMPQTATKTR